jgi:hypothetical protein
MCGKTVRPVVDQTCYKCGRKSELLALVYEPSALAWKVDGKMRCANCLTLAAREDQMHCQVCGVQLPKVSW